MQCPACHSASPDNVRFCLHCGYYLGDPDEVTRVRASRPPPTTIRADFPPPQYTPRGPTFNYEAPVPRRWPKAVAFVVLAAIGLSIVALLAASLIRDSGGIRVPIGERELTVLTTPTPFVKATPRPTAQPTIESTRATSPVVKPDPILTTPEPEPTATPFRPSVVLEWSDWLADGAAHAWTVTPGTYEVFLTATGDGAVFEFPGSTNCIGKTKPLLRVTVRCEMPQGGQFVITNPTTFGLGAAVHATVKVSRVQ